MTTLSNSRVPCSVIGALLATLTIGGACRSDAADRERTILLWTIASDSEHWRSDNAHEALDSLLAEAPDLTGWKARAPKDPARPADYKKKFTMAAEAGKGPDIVLSGHEDIPVWGSAGYITPIMSSVDELLRRFPQFRDVHPALWPSVTWKGQVWAIPQDVEVRPLFYSKTKLRELGWSQADIDSLPERITRGEYTLDDMLDTARQAIDRGVVRAGHGFWHRSRVGSDFLMFYVAYGGRLYDEDSARLVVTRSALLEWFRFQRRVITSGVTPGTLMGTAKRIWHDNVAHHNVLFWSDGCWAWGDWIENYLEGDAATTFPERTGYALMPSGIRGRPGSTLSHPMVYMVTKSSVSGKDHQEPAQRLLAHMTTPKRAMRHAVESAHLSIMRNSSYDPPEGPQSDRAMAEQRRFLRSVSYMLDHNYYLPNSPYYSQYFEIVWENMLATTLSKRSPERAAELAIAELRTELGDALLVE